MISLLNNMYRKKNLNSFKSLLIFLSDTTFKLRNILQQMLVPDKRVLQSCKLFTKWIWRSFTQGIPSVSLRNKFTEMKTRNNWLGHHGLTERRWDIWLLSKGACRHQPSAALLLPPCPTTQLRWVNLAGWTEPRSSPLGDTLRRLPRTVFLPLMLQACLRKDDRKNLDQVLYQFSFNLYLLCPTTEAYVFVL